MDSRIGKHGSNEPQVCAVTLQPCAGQHASHYSIGGGYYIAIMEKAAKGMTADAIEAVRDECRDLAPSTQRKPKVIIKKEES